MAFTYYSHIGENEDNPIPYDLADCNIKSVLK